MNQCHCIAVLVAVEVGKTSVNSLLIYCRIDGVDPIYSSQNQKH